MTFEDVYFGTKSLPNLKEVFAKVQWEETRRKGMSSPVQISSTETVVQGSALVAK